MNSPLLSHLAEKMAQRHEQHRIRQLITRDGAQDVLVRVAGETLINFSSNDYLNLANHPLVKEAAVASVQREGLGAGASHLISGHSTTHAALEVALAEFLDAPQVMVFSSGYLANLALLTTLFEKPDLIVQDKLNHASLIDAARFSNAQHRRYRHLDVASLQQQLKGNFRIKAVVTDGVFSMDGDCANVAEYLALPELSQQPVIVDDAHGIGVMGERGAGTCEALSHEFRERLIVMGTLGKALGAAGAFVAGATDLIAALQQFARPYIYTTALAPAVAAGATAAIRCLMRETGWVAQLHDNIAYFKRCAAQADLSLLPSNSAIQPLLVGGESECMALAKGLWQNGFWVGAIRPPTVAAGACRLRITITREHSRAQIERLVSAIAAQMSNVSVE
ncbi:MAG: 8-amino-7-oxononanoate synthase [Gammaproteobacteria bacterium]|nr:8-amino-7-oxononanoate synthase [Gammaproteobacteria bacterium]